MKIRVGLGEAVIGAERKSSDANPSITFRKKVVRGTVGNDITNDCLSSPDFTLEIVGLEGLVVLEEMIKRVRKNLEMEEEYLNMLVGMDYLLGRHE